MKCKRIFKKLSDLSSILALVLMVVFGLVIVEISEAATCSSNASCSFGQVCSNGVCVDSTNCTSKSTKQCYNYDVYWYDSCGVRGEMFQDCGVDSFLSKYRCSSTMVQEKMVGRGCDQGVCMEVTGWVDRQNCADTGLTCLDGACRNKDVAPPILYYLLPSGKVTSNSAALSLTTSEAAECHYGYYDVSYEQMGMKFSSYDGVHHSASIKLSSAGSYVFYVRCRDHKGNTNLSSSKISFTYVSGTGQSITVTDPGSVKDTTPPEIQASSLLPTGKVDTATINLALKTNEKASCRYDIADSVFDSMENSLNADNLGTTHQKTVTLAGAGRYVYYVRCKDTADNANTQSSRIEFEYVGVPVEPEFTVTGGLPVGTIYQKAVALEVTTSGAASCRYSVAETDFDSMEDLFSTSDGLQHMAVVTLGDYGNYAYSVSCRSNKDAAKTGLTQITFEYKDPKSTETQLLAPSGDCKTMTNGAGDGKCTPVKNCVCDPDCPGSANQPDPDCGEIPETKAKTSANWAIWGVVVVVVVVVAVFVLLKRRSGGEDDGGEEDESLGL